jgi:hypothetical protein
MKDRWMSDRWMTGWMDGWAEGVEMVREEQTQEALLEKAQWSSCLCQAWDKGERGLEDAPGGCCWLGDRTRGTHLG